MATFFFPQGGRHGCREVQLYFETGSSSFPSPHLQFLNVQLTDLFLEFLWGPSLPLELFCRPLLWLEAFTRHGLRHFFLSFSSTVLLLAVQIIRAAVALATLIDKNPKAISFIYPKHFLPHNDTNKAKQRQVQIYIIRPCLHSTTLYCWSGAKTLPDRASVTHENDDFGPVSVTERSCAAPILKVDRHRLVYVPLFSALTPRFNLIKLLQV